MGVGTAAAAEKLAGQSKAGGRGARRCQLPPPLHSPLSFFFFCTQGERGGGHGRRARSEVRHDRPRSREGQAAMLPPASSRAAGLALSPVQPSTINRRSCDSSILAARVPASQSPGAPTRLLLLLPLCCRRLAALACRLLCAALLLHVAVKEESSTSRQADQLKHARRAVWSGHAPAQASTRRRADGSGSPLCPSSRRGTLERAHFHA